MYHTKNWNNDVVINKHFLILQYGKKIGLLDFEILVISVINLLQTSNIKVYSENELENYLSLDKNTIGEIIINLEEKLFLKFNKENSIDISPTLDRIISYLNKTNNIYYLKQIKSQISQITNKDLDNNKLEIISNLLENGYKDQILHSLNEIKSIPNLDFDDIENTIQLNIKKTLPASGVELKKEIEFDSDWLN